MSVKSSSVEFCIKVYDPETNSYSGAFNRVDLRCDYSRVIVADPDPDSLCAAVFVARLCAKTRPSVFVVNADTDLDLDLRSKEKVFFVNFQDADFENSTFLVPHGDPIETPRTIVAEQSRTKTVVKMSKKNSVPRMFSCVSETETRDGEFVRQGIRRFLDYGFSEMTWTTCKSFFNFFSLFLLGCVEYREKSMWAWSSVNNVRAVMTPFSAFDIDFPAKILGMRETPDTITVFLENMGLLEGKHAFQTFRSDKRDPKCVVGIKQKKEGEPSPSLKEVMKTVGVWKKSASPRRVTKRSFNPFPGSSRLDMRGIPPGKLGFLAECYPSCLRATLEVVGEVPQFLRKVFQIPENADAVKTIQKRSKKFRNKTSSS